MFSLNTHSSSGIEAGDALELAVSPLLQGDDCVFCVLPDLAGVGTVVLESSHDGVNNWTAVSTINIVNAGQAHFKDVRLSDRFIRANTTAQSGGVLNSYLLGGHNGMNVVQLHELEAGVGPSAAFELNKTVFRQLDEAVAILSPSAALAGAQWVYMEESESADGPWVPKTTYTYSTGGRVTLTDYATGNRFLRVNDTGGSGDFTAGNAAVYLLNTNAGMWQVRLASFISSGAQQSTPIRLFDAPFASTRDVCLWIMGDDGVADGDSAEVEVSPDGVNDWRSIYTVDITLTGEHRIENLNLEDQYIRINQTVLAGSGIRYYLTGDYA